MVHIVTDLEAYYDRQLVSIESLILESIGADRKAILILT